MSTAGVLAVTARFAGGCLATPEVLLQRPPVTRLFIGQLPEAVVKTIPYLYTLCAQAQRAAAQAALDAARGEPLHPADAAPLWSEMLHEHLWRLLLDWPQALAVPQAREALAAWRNARTGDSLVVATERVLTETLLGIAPAAWQGAPAPGSLAARCLAVLGDGAIPADFDLPPLTPAAWLAYWQDEAAGEPAVLQPASVADAYRQRLQETVLAARALAAGAPYPIAAAGEGDRGVGQTLTARGVLTHAVRLEGGKVAAYSVWAPTDCHFADGRGLAALVAGKQWPDLAAARRGLERAVLALDPCLPYELKVSHA